MLKLSEEIYVGGRSIDIESASITELSECLSELKSQEKSLITKQNDLLSKVLE